VTRATHVVPPLLFAALLPAACVPAGVPTRAGRIHPAYLDASVEEVRDAFTAVLERPQPDVDWLEVTLLDRAVVAGEAEERARLAGLPASAVAARRGRAVAEATNDRTVFEVWLSATCDRCLDLRRWGFVLKTPDGAVHRPRWTESEVVDARTETLTVLDASRQVTRAYVRGRLVFAAGVLPAAGVLGLLASRPEGWDRPLELSWRLSSQPEELAPAAWLTTLAERLAP